MSIIEFKPQKNDKDKDGIPIEELPNLRLHHSRPFALKKAITAETKSINPNNIIKYEPREDKEQKEYLKNKIIDGALVVATLVGIVAIIWYLHDVLGINDIRSAQIPEVLDKLAKIDSNSLLNNAEDIVKLGIGRLR